MTKSAYLGRKRGSGGKRKKKKKSAFKVSHHPFPFYENVFSAPPPMSSHHPHPHGVRPPNSLSFATRRSLKTCARVRQWTTNSRALVLVVRRIAHVRSPPLHPPPVSETSVHRLCPPSRHTTAAKCETFELRYSTAAETGLRRGTESLTFGCSGERGARRQDRGTTTRDEGYTRALKHERVSDTDAERDDAGDSQAASLREERRGPRWGRRGPGAK